jgi:hypothetical protein
MFNIHIQGNTLIGNIYTSLAYAFTKEFRGQVITKNIIT